LKIDGVTSVSASSNIPGSQFNQHEIAAVKYPQDDIGASEALVDYDFLKTLNLQLTEGRFFDRNNVADSAGTYVINETAAKQLNVEGSVVGQEVIWHRDEDLLRGTVIGVVKDFHFQSLHEPIRPILFALSDEEFNYILIKMNTSGFNKKIQTIEQTYKKFEPIFGFEFAFMEDHLNKQYEAEQRTGNILATFSFIAILIACFGLFGMSMLTFYQKIKEVSIRKVLGASFGNLLVLLIGDFTKLILISVVIAVPFAWWIMDEWLNNFSYQININPLVFMISGLILIVISWITLSYFTVKASRLNPAETLKNE
jgi:putative ABC transport system permease protein